MPYSLAGQLARHVPSARLGDPLSLVAENLRNAPHGVLPVLDRATFGDGAITEMEARVVGLIDDAALARATNRVITTADGGSGVETEPALALQDIKARDIMRADVPIVPAIFSLENTLLTLDRFHSPALPVIDEAGYYRGFISRADVLSALAGGVRPPVVGGMATPLGVWLTDGRLTGGAPNFGLFLSGALLACCLMLSDAIPQLFLARIGQDWAASWTSGRFNNQEISFGFFPILFTFVHSLLFLALLRALPLSGVHAAEHQTVWALERGLPLEREFVSQMPRAHPRCGTNLMALGSLILISAQHAPVLNAMTILLILIAAFFFWRSLGTWMQNELTTRPPSPAQLDSGINAAKELLAKYQEQPELPTSQPLRLLNSGMIWSALGVSVTMYLWELARHYVAYGLVATPTGP